MTPRTTQFAGQASGPVVLVAIIASLQLLGSGVLAAPPVTSLGGIEGWLATRDAPTIGLAVLRLLALAAAYHLAATTALALLGQLARRPGVGRLAERATFPPFRSAVRHAAGLAISTSAILSSAATLRQVPSVQPTEVPIQHLVRPGDHLWSIAEQRLAAGVGRQPSEPEITAYWLSVVAANPQLVDPDLLFSGEPIQLPPLPLGTAPQRIATPSD